MKPFDDNGNFIGGVSDQELLRRETVRGAGKMIFASGASFVVQTVATLVLARLLTPNDFGVVTMVTTFSLLVSSFGLNGFTEAILQREDVSNALVSNLFWINVGCAVLLTLAFAASAPLLGLFYRDALVVHVAEAMSLTILVASFSVIHLALLNRAMRFTAVSMNTIVARVFSVLVSIALAFWGWGYWALVAGYVAQQTSMSIGAWLLCHWLPALPRRKSGTGQAVKFAMNVYAHFGFNYFAGNSDNLLVGWRFGARNLGFYKKAFDLFTLPICQLVSPIGAVIIGTLSRLNRDRAQYLDFFLSGLSVLAFVGMAIGADFTLIGKDLIRIILGPSWGETGRIFAFFGPGIGAMLIYNTHGWIHLSIGRPDRWFRWAVIEFFLTAGLFLIALPWGPRGIALAWTVSFFLLIVPSFWYAGKPIELGILPIVSIIWKFIAASLVAALGAAYVIQIMAPFANVRGVAGAFDRSVVSSVIFLLFYFGAVIAVHRGIGPFRQVIAVVSKLLPSQSRAELEPEIL